jgi:L-rhamnose mutarotase
MRNRDCCEAAPHYVSGESDVNRKTVPQQNFSVVRSFQRTQPVRWDASRRQIAVQRYAQIIRLRPEDEAEYIRYHAAVWPTVLATIAACHIRNYSIFLRNGMLFAYFEYHGEDYAADMLKMAADPETQRWWTIMDPMQQPVDDAAAGEKWSQLREVFHTDLAPVA